jgi:hypothetical protein
MVVSNRWVFLTTNVNPSSDLCTMVGDVMWSNVDKGILLVDVE